MRHVVAFAAGGVFGTGLLISGMTETSKVQGWLDFFGAWDPTLAFVIGGAIVPMFIAWRFAERRRASVLGTPIPQKSDPVVTPDLAIGSLVFGAGWGLVGLCPGPALASLSYGGWQGLVFLVAMTAGMLVAPPLKARLVRPSQTVLQAR